MAEEEWRRRHAARGNCLLIDVNPRPHRRQRREKFAGGLRNIQSFAIFAQMLLKVVFCFNTMISLGYTATSYIFVYFLYVQILKILNFTVLLTLELSFCTLMLNWDMSNENVFHKRR